MTPPEPMGGWIWHWKGWGVAFRFRTTVSFDGDTAQAELFTGIMFRWRSRTRGIGRTTKCCWLWIRRDERNRWDGYWIPWDGSSPPNRPMDQEDVRRWGRRRR